MRIIRSIAFYASLGGLSLVSAPVGFILYLMMKATSSAWVGKIARITNWIYGVLAIRIIGIFVRTHRINTNAAKGIGPCIIVCNHQSVLDLFLLGAQGNPQVCPVTKSWPFRLLIPFIPAMHAAGYVNAEDAPGETVAEKCRKLLSENCALVFYPEGRRSRNGALGVFHSGAFRLALEECVPIVPMIVRGTGKIILPGHASVDRGEISVEMLDPILPTEYAQFRSVPLPHRELLKYVRNMYRSRLEEGEDR